MPMWLMSSNLPTLSLSNKLSDRIVGNARSGICASYNKQSDEGVHVFVSIAALRHDSENPRPVLESLRAELSNEPHLGVLSSIFEKKYFF